MANEIQELKFQVGEAWKGVYSSSTAYGLANVVQDPTGLSIYRSLKSGNVGHPLSDNAWWFCIIDMSSIKAESDRIAALNQAIAQDEALRVAAEELRQQHEAERVAAETQRNEAEQQRISAEQARVNAESARETAEQQRITAEQGRVSAESARVQAEQARVLAETLRANAEDQRAANEQNRVAAEQQRIERAEQDHQRAESDHATYVDSLGAFDISSYHATDGVLAKYADLTAAIGTNGANVPESLRKGGMSVKFVQSSDNKYVQFFLTKDEWSANEADWEKINLEKELEQILDTETSTESSNESSVRIDYTFSIGDILQVKLNSVTNGRCMVLRNGSYETSNRLADTNVILGSVHITEANKWYDVLITNNIEYITVVNNGETPVTFNIRKCGEIGKKAYEVENDVKSSITVNVDSSTGGNTLSVDGNKKGEFADNSKLIKLVGISSNAAGSGVSKVGDVFFNTTSNLLHRCKVWNGVAQDSTYETVPFYEGAIYTYNDKLYIWDGTNLVNKTPESTDEVEYSEKLLQSKAVYGDIMSLRSVVRKQEFTNYFLGYDCSSAQYFYHGTVDGGGVRVDDTWNANNWMFIEINGINNLNLTQGQKMLVCLDLDITVTYNGSSLVNPILNCSLKNESYTVIARNNNTAFETGRRKIYIELEAEATDLVPHFQMQYVSKSAINGDGINAIFYGVGLFTFTNDDEKQVIINSFEQNSKQSKIIISFINGLEGKVRTTHYEGDNLYADPNCLSTSYVGGIGTKTLLSGGGFSFSKVLASNSNEWLSIYLATTAFSGITLISNHKYLVVLDIQFDSLTVGGVSKDVNIQFSTGIRRESDNVYIAKGYTPTFDTGVRNQLAYVLSPSENSSSFFFSFEYGTKLSLAGDGCTGKLYNVAVLDITDISKSFALSLLDKYGFISAYEDEQVLLVSDYAKGIDGLDTLSFWGDSLMNGSYPQMVAEHFGKNYVKNNWGSQVSSTIRDKFIERATNYPEELNNTHIFCIGRNNYTRPQDVVRDLKIMVSYLPHNRYIIMMPPNGNYEGEYKGESNYHYFTELADALQKAFGNAFCDWRKELINMYNYGGVKLLASFTQPAINSNVQINVSDANFLNFSNAYFPSGQVGYVRIGNMYDEIMNKYQVISIDDSTHITIKAVEADWKSAGNTIANHHYTDNGADSYGYLDIILEADYQTWIGDNTPASLRSDNIHMESVSSQEFCAMLVERELSTRGFGF